MKGPIRESPTESSTSLVNPRGGGFDSKLIVIHIFNTETTVLAEKSYKKPRVTRESSVAC